MRIEDFSKVIDILVSFLGETKNGFSDSGQGQFNCPQCAEENGGIPDNKYNLEVNLFKQKFQCWKCAETDGIKGSLGFLVKRFGGKRLYQEYRDEIKSLRRSSLYVFDEWDDAPVENFETFLTLPKTYSRIDLKAPLDRRLIDYLDKRKIDQETIDRFRIGYTRWENDNPRWSYRIIVPSFDQFGDLNYWTGRDYTGKSFQKYCNCDADRKAIIFQEGMINFDAPIYLVEGIFDALRFPNSISLMGKVLKEDTLLYQTLINKANSEVVVCLDGDTSDDETFRICSLLSRRRLADNVMFIRLGKEETPYKDFSEAVEYGGRKALMEIIRTKKKFSEIIL